MPVGRSSCRSRGQMRMGMRESRMASRPKSCPPPRILEQESAVPLPPNRQHYPSTNHYPRSSLAARCAVYDFVDYVKMLEFKLLLKLLGVLIDTALSFETYSFLRDLTVLAMLSPDYTVFLSRIMVASITLFKDPRPPRHEGIIAELIDAGDPDSKPFLIFLERTASDKRPDSRYFSNHPNSGTVLESIVRTLKEMPTILASLATSGSNDTKPPPHLHTSSPYQPLVNEPEPDHQLDDKPEPEPERKAATRLPWFDAVTLASTKVLHASTQLSGIHYHAEDRFIGSQNVAAYVPALHNLRQIKLDPNAMRLFDLAALADCVHNHDPLYTVLEHHCYWFVQIISAIIERTYPCTIIHNKKYEPVSEDKIYIPANDYLPDLAGRTMGIMICKVEEAVISVVADKFREFKEAKYDEVKAKWEEYHQPAEENTVLRERVSRLESLLRAHNLDPNVDVDSHSVPSVSPVSIGP